MRTVVRLLTSDDAAPLTPPAGLSDLNRIVDTMQEAGLQIQRTIAPGEAVPPEIAVAAVRITSEALANVLRHRGPGKAWIEVVRGSAALSLLVEDDGPGTWRPEAADPSWFRAGHHGVIGMREQAQFCGGGLLISQSPRGGWRVAATLPVP
jgi:signal transduction histidine kinase